MSVRFKAKQRTYLDIDNRTTFSVWHPQVKIGGEWCYIFDGATKSKMAEAPDEETAIRMAIDNLDKLPSKVGIDPTESA